MIKKNSCRFLSRSHGYELMKPINRLAAVVMFQGAVFSTGVQTASAVASNDAGTRSDDRSVPDHVVVVIFENRSYADMGGNPPAPPSAALAAAGANFGRSRNWPRQRRV